MEKSYMFEHVSAADRPDFSESITIYFSDEGAENAIDMQQRIPDVTKSLEANAWRYNHIGDFSGAPVYKQEAEASNNAGLLLIHVKWDETGQRRVKGIMHGWFFVSGSLTAVVDMVDVKCKAEP